MKRPSKIALSFFIFLSMPMVYDAGVVSANEGQGLSTELVARGWEEITFDGKRPNAFASCGDHCIKMTTMSSVSMIGKPVTIDLSQKPLITWEWKVTQPVPQTDLATKGKDDRAAAIYVTFPYDPDTSSFSERIMRPFIEIFRGKDTPGRAISYVWGGYGEIRDIVESPFFGDINAMIISRNENAPVGEWIMEKLDIIADHQRAFGYTPTSVSNILLSADSDDTKAPNQVFIRNIEFVSK